MKQIIEFSFFAQLKQLIATLKQQPLAEVFRTISFPPFETFGPHAHLRFEINYVKKGICMLHLEGGSFYFHEGEIMIINSRVEHTFESGKHGVTLLQLEIHPEVFTMFEQDTDKLMSFPVFSSANGVIKLGNNIRIMQVIKCIINELNAGNKYYQEIVVIYYAELLILVYRCLEEIGQSVVTNHFLIEAIRYMQANIQQEINIGQIAGNLGISERYLRKLFVQSLNMSPVKYLNQIRVNKAIELIKNSDLTIKEICFRCGFNTPRYFSHIFKQRVGCIPKDFRNK